MTSVHRQARIRHAAEGVIASYIHDLSTRTGPGTARAGAAASQHRQGRRRRATATLPPTVAFSRRVA